MKARGGEKRQPKGSGEDGEASHDADIRGQGTASLPGSPAAKMTLGFWFYSAPQIWGWG